MADPLSIAASVVALVQLCKGLYDFFIDAGETGRALRNDIKEPQNQLTELRLQYEGAKSENVQIPLRISRHVKDIQVQCKGELDALRRTLEPMRLTVADIVVWLKKPDAVYIRDCITKYQQSLHFYFVLVNTYFPVSCPLTLGARLMQGSRLF
jgi:hypothetical protein